MTDRKFYPLLIAWTLLAIVPGTYVTLAYHVGLATEVGGAALGIWIGGWLAQFAAFFWLMAIVKKQNFLWWFIASALPYAIDWVTPVSTIALIVLPGLAVATAVWIAVAEHSYESLAERGIHATGVVLQVYQPMMNVVINGVYIKRKLRLRVERSDGAAPYEASYNGLFMIGDIPDAGARIPLLVDPSNPQHLQYRDGDG